MVVRDEISIEEAFSRLGINLDFEIQNILKTTKEPEKITEEIRTKAKSAYRELAMKYHPDLNKDDPICEDKMKDILQAYEKAKNVNIRLRSQEPMEQRIVINPFGGFQMGGVRIIIRQDNVYNSFTSSSDTTTFSGWNDFPW